MAMLAAIGLTAAAEQVVGGWWRRPRLVAAALAAALVVASAPATLATLRVLSFTWNDPEYAHLDERRDRLPAFGDLLPSAPASDVVLTYEDWSSLVWYETGVSVIAVKPPGYAKLAFDPTVFTGRSQADRRGDLADALRGDPAALAGVASRYDANWIVLARRGDEWGLIHRVGAVVATKPAATAGTTRSVDGNGWDGVELGPDGRLSLDLDGPGEPVDLVLRFLGEELNRPVGERRFRLLAGDEVLAELVVPPSGLAEWQEIETTLVVPRGQPLILEAVDRLTFQSATGFEPGRAPDGWQVVEQTPEAVVLQPVR
jgi:hypothetical protein